jgi:hypothetical protein
MPHYKNGAEARVGDRLLFTMREVVGPAENRRVVDVKREGLLFALAPSADTCNANVAYPHLDVLHAGTTQEVRTLRVATATVTLRECEKCA